LWSEAIAMAADDALIQAMARAVDGYAATNLL